MAKPLRPLDFADSLTDRLSIRQRLVGAIALILTLFALGCLISLATFALIHRAQVFANSVHTLLMKTAELSDALSQQRIALRGYVLSGATRDLHKLADTHARVSSALGALEASRPGPMQRKRLARVKQLESRWYAHIAAPVIQHRDVERARRYIRTGASRSIFNPMQTALAEFRSVVLQQLTASNATLDYRTQLARWTLIGMLVFGLVIGLITARTVIRRITKPLFDLARATRRLARDERDVIIKYQKRADEIGTVARAIEAGRRILIDQDRQAWVRDHRARLTALLHQCRNEKQLGDRLLAELATLFGAGYATLFTPASLAEDEDHFAVLSAYACDPAPSARFGPGAGLVGQVLVSRAPIVIDELPESYVPVRSGLGAAAPTVLVVMPALVSGQVVAIIELALFRHLRKKETLLLKTLLPNVALALRSHARTRRTAQLLEQSRAQTEALRDSEQQLRAQSQELAELRDETERRADALARANQYKSYFLSNMSHELRTPLNSLLILARELTDNEAGNLSAEQVEAADIIHDSGRNLLALINDILDLSKIEAGKMAVTPAPLALTDLIHHIERDFAPWNNVPRATGKGLAFHIRRSEGMPASIVTDVGKLEQIVRNLVGNAIKFTEDGAVTVEIARPAAGQVFKTEGLRPDNALAIHVIDDGIGIPADRLEQIFQAFEQVDVSTSRRYGGTALGLSISRELARLLGGEISLASTLGQGSCFSLFFRRDLKAALPDESDKTTAVPPAVDEVLELAAADATGRPFLARVTSEAAARKRGFECLTAARERDAGNPKLTGATALLVDDDMRNMFALSRALRECGLKVLMAGDGTKALAQLSANEAVAVVLMDIMVPGMAGFATIRRIRAQPRYASLPIIALTAKAMADDKAQSLAAGASAYLPKPIAIDALTRTLDALL